MSGTRFVDNSLEKSRVYSLRRQAITAQTKVSSSIEAQPAGRLARLLASNPVRPLRFLFVGAVTFVINIGVLSLLESAGLNSVPAYAIALGVSAQFNFLISYFLVWADRRLEGGHFQAWLQRWLSFHGCIAAAVGLNMAVFVLVSMWLPEIGAVVVATGSGTALKFVFLDRVTFRTETALGAEAEPL